MLLAIVPGEGDFAQTTLVLFVLLAAVVGTHYRKERRLQNAFPARPPLLASPLHVAVALSVVIGMGSLLAIALALLLSTIGGFAGNGSTLLRLLLGGFALGPCLSIGSRCGRWWSFSGSILLTPVAAACLLTVGPRSLQGVEDVAFIVVATALVVATGSLQHQLNRTRRRTRAIPLRNVETAISLAPTATGPLNTDQWAQSEHTLGRSHTRQS